MKMLIISSWFPYPPINGAKIRKHNLIRQLSKFGEIDLIALVQTLNDGQVKEGKEYLKQYCRSVKAIPAIPYRPSTPAYRKLLSRLPDVIQVTRNLDLETCVLQTWNSGNYDVCIASEDGPVGLATFTAVNQKIRPLVVDSVELGVLRPKGDAFTIGYLRRYLTWVKEKKFWSDMLHAANVVTVTSQQEYNIFHRLIPASTSLVIAPNVLHIQDYAGSYGEHDRRALIHCGSFSYSVNYDAVRWFSENVFGLIKAKDSLRFKVTGNTAGRDLSPILAACPQVQVTGLVKEIYPHIAQSGISIVPILAGGSTRLKILESMILGTPVVSTRLGAEGIHVKDGENILLADSPEDFAWQIDRLVEDDELWQRISTGGRKLVESQYASERMGNIYHDIFARLLPLGTKASA